MSSSSVKASYCRVNGHLAYNFTCGLSLFEILLCWTEILICLGVVGVAVVQQVFQASPSANEAAETRGGGLLLAFIAVL